MNFLAHLYLSGENESIMVGNFIGDYVKGKQYEKFPPQVQTGIFLHRQIDYFTDTHPVALQSGKRFKANYGRYSGVVTDVIFDHFLATNWNTYSIYTLRQFSKNAHAVLLSHFNILPNRVRLFLPFLIQHKRLESYAGFEGIWQSLEIMGRRTSLPEEADFAIHILKTEYEEIQQEFELFFADLLRFVQTNYEVEIKKPR
ncbi:MAG TPA: ACP phosphodiesterase [Sunxiuqinia sp.]|nr:ACP phosphodiesterase [Sunxiuqinia sp.]